MSKYNEMIIEVLYNAVEKSFTDLFKKHSGEHFYYCTLVMADTTSPCISAQSEESLKKYFKDKKIDESKIRISDYKWSWADSLYCAYGYDEYFGEVEKLFKKDFRELLDSGCTDDDLEEEYQNWFNAMETVMKMLDEKGFFGTGKEREEVFVYAEESPPEDEDEIYYERAKRMNPPAAYERWLGDLM